MQTCALNDGFVRTGIIASTYGQVSVNATRCRTRRSRLGGTTVPVAHLLCFISEGGASLAESAPINASPSLGNPGLDAHHGLRDRTENDPLHERVAQSLDVFFLFGREVHFPEDARDLMTQDLLDQVVVEQILALCSPPPTLPFQSSLQRLAIKLGWRPIVP